MGQLTEITFETTDIQVRAAKGDRPAQFITVRGIALEDIMKLVMLHGPDLVKLFDKLTTATTEKGKADFSDGAQVVLAAAEQAPELLADIIVLATDSVKTSDAHNIARRLPLPVQVRAVEEIARLTFEEHGGLGEFLETITRMFGGVNGLLTKLRASQAGFLASDAP